MKYRINLLMNDGEKNLRKIQKNYINDKYFYQFFCKIQFLHHFNTISI